MISSQKLAEVLFTVFDGKVSYEDGAVYLLNVSCSRDSKDCQYERVVNNGQDVILENNLPREKSRLIASLLLRAGLNYDFSGNLGSRRAACIKLERFYLARFEIAK